MARIRYLKPEFFKNEDLVELPDKARLAFAGLWCWADKEGRLEDRPRRLKAEIFPYEKVDFEEILNLLAASSNKKDPFIIRYEVEDKEYIQIKNWNKHQKPHHTEKKSEIPPYDIKYNIKNNIKIKIMGKGMGKQHEASAGLDNRSLTVNNSIYSDEFLEFWEIYPKKIGKGKAFEEYERIKQMPDNKILIEKVKIYKETRSWKKDNGQFIPHPATWLHQRRWEDEVEKEKVIRGQQDWGDDDEEEEEDR